MTRSAWLSSLVLSVLACGRRDDPERTDDTPASDGTADTSSLSPDPDGDDDSELDGAGSSSDGTPDDPPGPTGPGTITSFPLPELADAPYSVWTSSKHTNMASDGVRLYVSGGDWTHSATDGTWSMDLADGSWRQDVGAPSYPGLPAPHALQDGAGFVWVAARSQFLLWPGSYFAYEEAGAPILEYARGSWWFDPVTNTYTQELGLFGEPGTGSGNLFGGVYDEVNDEILVFMDASAGLAARRWSVGEPGSLPDIPFELALPPGRVAYFTGTQHVKIDRHVYIVGIATSGETSSQTPLLLRWDLDEHVMQLLAPPPVDGTRMVDIEIRLGTSHGKVVWPFTTGPEGEIHGIHVYDPAEDSWFTDDQIPEYGNFIGNAVTSLSDDRVVWCGGVFGRQQTHVWFYEAG